MPGLRLPTIQELAAAQQAQQDAPQEDWGLTMTGRMAHMLPPTAATGAGGGSGGKIERSPIADFARSLFVARPEDAARRAAYAQANAQMLGLGQEGGAPPAAPQGPEAPLQTVNMPYVPSNAPDPRMQAQMIQAFQANRAGPTQIRRPSLQMTGYQDPEVQAQLQRPEVQAAMAPSAGDIQFSPDAFLQRPDGEAGLENFMFREMAVLGSRTPQALQSGWLQIQQAKRQRIGARADYLAGLVKQRFAADLQRRNQGDMIQAQDGWKALDRVAQIRAQEAQLDLQTRIANANLLEQFKGRMAAQDLAELKAKLGAGDMEVKRADRLYKASGLAEASVKSMQAAAELTDYIREIMGSSSVGLGDLSKAITRVKEMYGAEQEQRLRMLINTVNQKAIAAYAEKAGVRGIDTKPEQEFLKSTNPSVGTDMNVTNEWLNKIMASGAGELKRTFEYMNDLVPGRGTKLNEEMQDTLRTLGFSQGVAAQQLRAEGGRERVFNNMPYTAPYGAAQ